MEYSSGGFARRRGLFAAAIRTRFDGRAAAPAGPRRAAHLIDCWYSVNPIDEQIAATIQKRRMILVSDHAISSKWWWTGAMRKTRLRKRWNENTWIATESASITKMPPMIRSSTSVWVITAMAAIAPPRPSDPVSPMNTAAGNELNHRNPTLAPTRHAHSSASAWIFG